MMFFLRLFNLLSLCFRLVSFISHFMCNLYIFAYILPLCPTAILNDCCRRWNSLVTPLYGPLARSCLQRPWTQCQATKDILLFLPKQALLLSTDGFRSIFAFSLFVFMLFMYGFISSFYEAFLIRSPENNKN